MISTLLYMFMTFSNFHGCALASDNLTGYVVTLDTTLLLKTSDGGATWVIINTTASRKFFDVTCKNGTHIWTCGILGEIMHSRDGGQTWQQQATGISKYMTRIEFLDTLTGWCVGGDGTIAYTTNGGDFWNIIFTPWYEAEYYGVSFSDNLSLYAVAGWPDNYLEKQGYIVKSEDGGATWTLLKRSEGFDEYLDIHVINNDTIVVVGGNDITLEPIILRSTDGGASWDSITSLPLSARYLRAVDFVGPKGWAVGRAGTILHTEDGGLTWISQYSPADSTLFDVDFSDEFHGIACGYNYIIYTNDGGQTWRPGYLQSIMEPEANILKFQVLTPIFIREAKFKVEGSENSKLRLKIYEASGNLIRVIENISGNEFVWDGKNFKGIEAKEGLYYALLEVKGKIVGQKLIKIR